MNASWGERGEAIIMFAIVFCHARFKVAFFIIIIIQTILKSNTLFDLIKCLNRDF